MCLSLFGLFDLFVSVESSSQMRVVRVFRSLTKTRYEMIFCSAYGAFGAEGTVLTRGGEGDSDVGEVEEVKQWL